MNNTVRLNITLPTRLGMRLKASKNASRTIAEALAVRYAAEDRERLEIALKKGYSARAEEDAATNKEYDHLSGEGVV